MSFSYPRSGASLVFVLLCYWMPSPLLTAQSVDAQLSNSLCDLSGSVVDSRSRQAVGDAHLRLHGANGDLYTTSTKDGTFTFSRLHPGHYRVFVDKDGYSVNDVQHSKALSLLPGGHAQHVELSMNRESLIAGRILDAHHSAISGVRVFLWANVFRLGRHTMTFISSSTTNDIGEFRLAGVAAGEYFLSAAPPLLPIFAPAPRSQFPQPSAAIVTTFYPNAMTVDEAQSIAIRSGEQREDYDIVMRSVNSFCISAILPKRGSRTTSNNFMGLKLSELMGDTELILSTERLLVPDSVEFCNVPAGSYILEGVTPWNTLVRADFVVSDRSVALGAIEEHDGMKITGVCFVNSAGSQQQAPGLITVLLQPVDRILFAKEDAAASTSNTGEFTIPYVFPGSFAVKVYGLPDGYYISKVETDHGQDATHQPLRVDDPQHLSLTIRSDAASLNGTVSDAGHPSDNARVLVIPTSFLKSPPEDDVVSVNADQNGMYKVPSLAPGAYLLLSVSAEEASHAADPVYLHNQQSKAVEVTLGPNQGQRVDLTLVHDR
jgi:hypothetical protein